MAGCATVDEQNRTELAVQSRLRRWRSAVKSSRSFWFIKRFLKRISGRELWIRRDTQQRTRHSDGWDYAPASLRPGSIVYAFGVGDTLAFELNLIARHGVVVHTFDPTPSALTWIKTQDLPNDLHFHPWAVAGSQGALSLYPRLVKRRRSKLTMWTIDPRQAGEAAAIDVPACTIASAMQALGHDQVDLLKLDVEGAEYDAISAMLMDAVLPTQLLVEFHHRFPGIGKQRTRACLHALREVGYRIFSVSRTGRELSLVRTVTKPSESRPTC